MEEKYGFFAQARDSVIKPDIALDIVDMQLGKAIIYLLKLCLLGALVSTVILLIQAYPLGGLKEFTKQIPDFELRNGHLHLDISKPVLINSNSGILIIENGGGSALLDKYKDYGGTVIYINSKGGYIKQGSEPRTFQWSDVDFQLSKATAESWFFNLAWVVILLAGAFMFLYFVASGLIFALIVAMIGLITNAVLKTDLAFGQLFALALFAMTAGRLMKIILELLHAVGAVDLGLPTLLNYVITTFLLTLYLNALKKRKDEELEPANPA
ncbi:MAG: DUF1189 domain-containing protein [Firmicutes bacterium]|nr:DUF1189 domain-containing protein [Bacillota bacterium]